MDPYYSDTIKPNANGSIPRPYIIVDNTEGSLNSSNSEIVVSEIYWNQDNVE